MKKQQKFLLLLLTTFLLFNVSCRKEIIPENVTTFSKSMSGKKLTSISEKQAIKDWLVEHDKNLNSKDKQTRELVSNNLNYDDITIESRKNGEEILIVPIKEPVKDHLNLNAKYLKLDANSLLNYVIVRSKEGKLRWSAIVCFLPDNDKRQETLLSKTIENMINVEPVQDEGMFKFLDIKGKLLYQLEYKGGKMTSFGSVIQRQKAEVEKLIAQQAKKKGSPIVKKNNQPTINNYPLPEDCEDFFLVTTYYDGEGGTYEEWEYLYTICDGESGGGGGGGGETNPPEEEIDMAISIGGQVQIEADYEEDDYAIDENGFGGTLERVPLGFFANWSGQRMALKNEILWLTMGDVKPDPKSVYYYTGSAKGWVTRNVEVTTTDKYDNIHSPLYVTATLTWTFNVSARYSYNSGITNTIPKYGKTHTKFIFPWTTLEP